MGRREILTNIIYCIVIFVLLISLVASFCYEVKEIRYVKITSENEEIILALFEEEDVPDYIPAEERIKRVGCQQWLGDWTLIIEYEDRNTQSFFLDDSYATDLHSYISKNGIVGGIYGLIARKCMMISFIIVMAITIFKLLEYGSQSRL